ncbi:hypothetical protein MPTK1_3g15340 [Marchantia polymorpha subsp. ruderalis]|uniref:Uncharacterized protein n=2 Tax=Marchantia polymorpha TaxID=3197 RepID=A0AAF6B122_MARPO|nr:hypothetical protein MARPO_0004s0138 [Marchantia polymorpha]BBN05706.1 hypothetical protein Mp_3g15340 [Marchantia polymorpha subsp. ruderalis]|eukprot:PTQ48875.1 hypothetical protein MARPO_0004s0138 [Marchantia polymorpha]
MSRPGCKRMRNRRISYRKGTWKEIAVINLWPTFSHIRRSVVILSALQVPWPTLLSFFYALGSHDHIHVQWGTIACAVRAANLLAFRRKLDF